MKHSSCNYINSHNILLVRNPKIAFLPNVKYFRKIIGIQFNSTPLIIEQNNYATQLLMI